MEKIKKTICVLGVVFGLSYGVFASAEVCANKIGVYEKIYNDTGKPLVASTFMSNNINGGNFPMVTNVSTGGNLEAISKGDVTIDSWGNVTINNACGNGKDNYDMGISVGPYQIFSQKGTWPDWDDGLDNSFLKYHLFTKKWNNDPSPYSWSVYAPGGATNYNLGSQFWYDHSGENACRQATSTSICMATDVKECHGTTKCRTWVIVAIHNLGNNNGQIMHPLGKY